MKIQVNSQGKAYLTTNNKVLVANVSGGKYQLLERIKDDSNNEIGTVSGFFKDSNNVEYAVVCLDAVNRISEKKWCSLSTAVTDMPFYQSAALYEAGNSAKTNCDLILAYCTAQSGTSESVSHCRSKSFTIGSVTYYGQLPNILELVDIFRCRTSINSADTTASSNPSLVIPTSANCWSSTQAYATASWRVDVYGNTANAPKTQNGFVIPVLEIPNN